MRFSGSGELEGSHECFAASVISRPWRTFSVIFRKSDTLSVLVAKGRAQVGVAASNGDWSKRIRDMQYTDHEDYTMGS